MLNPLNFRASLLRCARLMSDEINIILLPHQLNYSLWQVLYVIQLKQGSEQAKFWQCTSCQQIVAVSCEIAGNLKGTVNANLFAQSHKLKTPVVVSPKLLSPEQKRDRWAKAWLSFSPELND